MKVGIMSMGSYINYGKPCSENSAYFDFLICANATGVFVIFSTPNSIGSQHLY